MSQIRINALVGASLFGLSAPALAQDEPVPPAEEAAPDVGEAGLTEGNEIIVQARRKDESLQDVPLSVQAVTGNQLAKLELRSFQDVAAIVPGLQLNRAVGGIQNTVTMRGVSFNPTSTGPQTAVELYRNDIVTTSSAIFQALYDIGQIEVLRGPQGTLRGRASPSGSITITTKRPDLFEAGGFVEGTVAQRDKRLATGALNIPIAEGKLGVRVAGYYSESQGNEIDRRAIGGRNADDQVESIRASVRADPFDGVLLLDANYETTTRKTLAFEQYESRSLSDTSGIIGAFGLITPDDRISLQAEPSRARGVFKFYNWQAQLRQLGQMLTYVGGRGDFESFNIAPEDPAGILLNPFARSATPDVNGVINVNQFAQLTFPSRQKQRVHEIRLQSEERIAGLFDYVVGYLNLKQNTPTVLYTPTSACAPLGTPAAAVRAACLATGLTNVTYGGVFRSRSDREESFFGNLTVHLGDSTEFSGGVRRIKFGRMSGLRSAPRNAVGIPLPDRMPEEQLRALPEVASFAVNDGVKKTIYTLSAKHNFTPDLMVYATYGTSFRPGNIVVCSRCNAAEGTVLNAGGFLSPEDETSRSVEGGFKASLLDRKVTANLSVFRQTFKNFTIGAPEPVQFLSSLTPPGFAISGTTNNLVVAVPVRIFGFEAELGFRPSERFNIATNVAYADSKVRGNGRVPCVDIDNDNFQDASLPATAAAFAAGVTPAGGFVDTCAVSSASPAPKWSASAQGEYNHPFGDSMQGFARGLLSYFGKTNGDDNNPVDSVSAYTLLNLYAGLREPDGAWEVSLFGKNLFGTDRVLSRTGSLATSVIAGQQFVSGYRRINTTSPREFGVTARIAFGSR